MSEIYTSNTVINTAHYLPAIVITTLFNLCDHKISITLGIWGRCVWCYVAVGDSCINQGFLP